MNKVDFKVLKDSKKDAKRKKKRFNREITVVYPKYKAEALFKGKKIEFSKYEFGNDNTSIEFSETVKLPKNRNEYGQEFVTANENLLIVNYKKDNKGNPIVTEIKIIGFDDVGKK